MNKAVLISIRPTWCAAIAAGRKTIEVRKTAPNLPTPFKCYIYCTKAKSDKDVLTPCNDLSDVRNGTVIGEFVCDNVAKYWANSIGFSALSSDSLVPARDLHVYAQPRDYLYGWHIFDLKIYDEPKKLIDFQRACDQKEDCCTCKRWNLKDFSCIAGITKAPQSWCYVEECDSGA